MPKKKVLIIDDSLLIQDIVKSILEAAGYAVNTASNAIDAVNIIFSEESRPDLILLDIVMPILSGNQDALLLKESEYCKDIPIVFISSKSEEELRQLAFETGVEGYICKPFSDVELVTTVERHLQGAAAGIGIVGNC
jgi:DNA-binding response OmpR family regulator